MILKKKKFYPIKEDSIILICVIRDEQLLIPYFIEHYTNLGITHFIFIDNGSEDGSLEYLLKKEDTNSQIWSTTESYAENKFGVGWVNNILNSQCKDKWCLVVDIDEFLQPRDSKDLNSIIQDMEGNGTNILQTCLIDFYPKSFEVEEYKKGLNPLSHSNHYDRMISDNIFLNTAPDTSFVFKGGLRHRILENSKKANKKSVCLSKKSFFKYTFYKTHALGIGMHWIFPVEFEDWSYDNWEETNKHLRYYNKVQIINHFKFIKPDIKKFFQLRIERNQDWKNAKEYKKYKDSLTDSYFDKNLSIKYSTIEDIYNNTISKIIKEN